ncbi:hypothetical protein DFP78_107246 [Photobacterium lutimaris]|nr:hypothetical protein DFP78_107246 [Photobacterium lutimaris]
MLVLHYGVELFRYDAQMIRVKDRTSQERIKARTHLLTGYDI